jgi:hypothetical protein
MQSLKRVQDQRSLKNHVLRAAALLLATVALSACQTGQMTPDQWNARTNALSAFSNATYQFSEAQRPVHIPGAPQKQKQIVCNGQQCFLIEQ